MTLPPLPPEHARKPEMLEWRLDVHERRLSALESRRSEPGSSESAGLPSWWRPALAGALLLAGATGHFPEAASIALKLLGL